MPKVVEMGECAVHGLVVTFAINDPARPQITTGPICPQCYIEWVKENVTQLQNVRLMQVT